MTLSNTKIDIVYLWVDGSDSNWIKKKAENTILYDNSTESNCKGRYADNDELKYSLRSLEKHAPWVRNVYLVTDNQIPAWLNTQNEKIKIIDHTQILPEVALPCFNAVVIEHYLYKIPDLSEHFLLANDDMFLYRNLNPDYFFAPDGYPYIRLKKRFLGKYRNIVRKLIGLQPGHYRQMIVDAAVRVEKKFGKYYSGVPHHNIDAYRKSDFCNAAEHVFKHEVDSTAGNHIRNYNDLSRAAFSYYALAINHAHLLYVNHNQSSRLLPNKHNMSEYLKKHSPDLFCINDSQRVTDEHRKAIKPLLEVLFPNKSSFEL